MPTSCTHVYVHFVWATWNKAPLITPDLEPRIYACIAAKCDELVCQLIDIGGTEDHVHCLVRLHATISVAGLAKHMKGASSHLVTHAAASDQGFKWQGTYGAFSVSPSDIDQVRAYIQRQKEHHAHGDTWPDWERCMESSDEND
jgi:REP element-mobilizing transposase RayT